MFLTLLEESLIDIVFSRQPSLTLINPILKKANKLFTGFLQVKLASFVAILELSLGCRMLADIEFDSQAMLEAI